MSETAVEGRQIFWGFHHLQSEADKLTAQPNEIFNVLAVGTKYTIRIMNITNAAAPLKA